MVTGNFYDDNPDLQFTIEHFLNWDKIVPLVEENFADAAKYAQENDPQLELAPSNTEEAVENYKMIFQQLGEIAGKALAPVAHEMDKEGLKFDNGKVIFPESLLKVLNIVEESGFLAYTCKRQYGGLNLSISGEMPILEQLSRGEAAFALVVGCFNLAKVIEIYGDEEMKKKYVPLITSGQMTSAMALTEPDFGSDLPHLRTSARQDDDGKWYITGTKRFITHGCGVGDKPSAILTLARTGAEGARGLSFFLVESNDVEIARIEEKMGLHCSPTCEVVYENSPAQLIGEPGKGLTKYAMGMMNGARLGIAIQGVGIGQAAYEEAKKYASERVQFGTTIDQMQPIKRILDEIDATVQAMRAITYKCSEFVDVLEGTHGKLAREGLNEKEIRKHPDIIENEKLAKLLTPTSKLFTSELVNKVAYDATGVFGGSGYTEDYMISKIYKDARICAIYEGTSQLQVIGAIGGIGEGMRPGGYLDRYLTQEIEALENPDLRIIFKDQLQTLADLVVLYKERSREEKDYLASDIVWYFAYLFPQILLASQLDLAKNKGLTEIQAMKEKALKNFQLIAKREMAKLEIQLREFEGARELVEA